MNLKSLIIFTSAFLLLISASVASADKGDKVSDT